MHTRPLLLVGATIVALCAAAGCSGGSSGSPDASAATTIHPVHWVVSLGDSYIAGEGDRWAGNTGASSTADFEKVDALGPFGYDGPLGLEDIPGCHRATMPEVAIDYGDVKGKNFACSGAETSTKLEGSVFKPGIDFYDKNGKHGQALDLQTFAKTHDVTAVVLSIGGNNFNFSTILTKCVEDFVSTASGTPTYCHSDTKLASYFTASYRNRVKQQIGGAIANIATAMQHAGKQPSDYRLIVQDYPSPVPPGSGFRYPQTTKARFDKGGCPIFNADANWANATVLTAINDTVRAAVGSSGLDNITFLDMSKAFDGHRLCEQGSAQIEQTDLASWKSPGAANDLEWVNQIYLKGIPWQQQESAHPNYWGTAAERNCLRQVVKAAASSDGYGCVQGGSTSSGNEPAMRAEPIVHAS